MLGMKKQKGMTLLEIIIALGIIGVVSAGVVVLAQRAIDAQNMTKATQAVNSIQIAMTQTYRNLGKYPQPTDRANALRVSQGLAGMGRVGADDLKNAFTGAEVPVFGLDRVREGDEKAFALAYEGLTLAQCRQLVSNTAEMFPYIEIQTEAESTPPAGMLNTNATGTGTGIIKSIGGGAQLNLADVTQVGQLCSGAPAEDGTVADTFSVLLGNG